MAVLNRRRRVDWPVILRSDPPVPKVVNEPAPSSLVALLSSFDEILSLNDPDAILRRAVELARERIGLARVGIFLLERSKGLMLGSWGSDLSGALVDEHQIMFAENHIEQEAFRRAEEEGAHFTVFDDCPLVEHRGGKTLTSGTGWVTCTPIRSGNRRIGMLFNDAGLSGAPLDVVKQAYAAILCSLLGTVLDPIRDPAVFAVVAGQSSARRLTTAAVELLSGDPALSSEDIARRHDVSLGRLTRAFKSEMGMSLVEYRNRLRLDRFTTLLDAGPRNLLDAALAAGFGSYAQFHRVFRALRHRTPREYVRQRA